MTAQRGCCRQSEVSLKQVAKSLPPSSDVILYNFPQSMLHHQSHQNHWGQLVKNTDSWTLPQPGRAQRLAFIHVLTVSLMHAAVGRTNCIM